MLNRGLLLAVVELGSYVSIWKTLLVLFVALIWARLLTWVDKDAEAAHLPRVPLNAGNVLGLGVAFALFLAIPAFALSLVVFLVIFIIEAAVYLILRHQKVGLGDLKDQFIDWVHSFTKRDKEVKLDAHLVTLFNKSSQPVEAPEDDHPDRAAFLTIQEILTDPLRKGAEKISVIPKENAAQVRYLVDGVPYDGSPVNKTDGAAAISFIKAAIGLVVDDKRKPQTANMKVAFLNKRHELKITTSGSTAGEAMVIEVDSKLKHEVAMDDLGFTADDMEVLMNAMSQDPAGIIILSAPEGQGLTTLMYSILRRHDAFLSHIQTVERGAGIDLEGITQNELASNATATEEAKQVQWVIDQQPDVVAISRIDDPRSAQALCKFAEEHRAYVCIRAGSTFDALAQWRKLVGNDRTATKTLRLVVNGRVVRKLCMACKVEYTPEPETLRRMNMSPERITKLFQARTQPLRDAKGNPMICEFCQDLHFKGRIGVFELFIVDDEVRQIVQAGGSVNQLKMVFKKQKRRYLQEQALLRAVAGDTSLQEVARVLRIGTEGGGGHSGGGGGGGGAAPATKPKPPAAKTPSSAAKGA